MPEYFEEIDATLAFLKRAASLSSSSLSSSSSSSSVVVADTDHGSPEDGSIHEISSALISLENPQTFSKATRYPSAEEGVNA